MFLERARSEAGIDIDVISGAEEARLIHLGVLQAVPVFERRLLLVDIGGGSTELLIGEKGETLAARSFKLGAVRLTDRFFPGGTATPKAVAACRDYVRGILSHFQRAVDEHGFDVAVASSGTAEAVAHVVHARTGAEALRTYNCFEMSLDDVQTVTRELARHRTTGARAKVPGLEPGRADIAVAGALILATVGGDVRGRDVHVQRGGAARRRARRHVGAPPRRLGDGRARRAPPARRLAAQHRPARRRAATTTRRTPPTSPGSPASCSTPCQPLHDLDGTAREYLEAGATLANVGLVVAHSKHHLHAYYVIRNSELAGLTDLEIEIIAQIARYHRKSEPKPSHAEFAALDAADQDLVRTLAGILRVAIGLDRSHQGNVESVRAEIQAKRVVVFATPRPGAEIGLELYAANERKDLLERVTGRRVELLPG